MATETKSEVKADSPELAALKFKEKDLLDKQKRLDGMQSSLGFDIDGAKTRTAALLAEVRKAIKDAK